MSGPPFYATAIAFGLFFVVFALDLALVVVGSLKLAGVEWAKPVSDAMHYYGCPCNWEWRTGWLPRLRA